MGEIHIGELTDIPTYAWRSGPTKSTIHSAPEPSFVPDMHSFIDEKHVGHIFLIMRVPLLAYTHTYTPVSELIPR